MENKYHYVTPIGTLCIRDNGNAITGLYLEDSYNVKDEVESPIIREAYAQLKEYFNHKRKKFDIPIELSGTEFQMKVWKALQTIPYGETCSYKDIAKIIEKPLASRAVGGANNKNPVLIIIPCHRVIGANGNLVGFGAGIDIKKYLLELEK